MLSPRDTDTEKDKKTATNQAERGRKREREWAPPPASARRERTVQPCCLPCKASLPATEPHRRVEVSVRGGGGAASRIQNTRSQIPLCLQFLYTTEGNNGTTVIWLQCHGAPRMMRNIVAHVALQTL